MDVVRKNQHCNVILFLLLFSALVSTELTYSGNGETRAYWQTQAKDDLRKARMLRQNIGVAKNVIIFLGDGMGVSTVTAARILKGQLENKTGEESVLSFETFPYVGLSKTYNQDRQTPDSAGTATAFLSGIKTNYGVLGVDGRSRRGDCATKEGTEINSILHWSKDEGKSVGVVTNTRITHATPAASYAHTPERDWEADSDMEGISPECTDIAKQLIDDNPDINVILGGGRRSFIPKDELDPEAGVNSYQGRLDGRNLINEWQTGQQERERINRFVWNQTEFDSVDPESTDYLLGLFNPSHMEYELERQQDKAGEPSLAEMTEKAIKILQRNEKGFFLYVESGRIDHAHHDNKAVKSLHEVLAFAAAVQKAMDLTDESDTLLVVTADHSHVFTIGGYPMRGKSIFGLADDDNPKLLDEQLFFATDKKPFSTLGYTNGPGGYAKVTANVRPNITTTNTADKDYAFQSAVHLGWETHGGEDVAIYARGPMSHLFHGVHEQHYIAHVMAYASCVGDYKDPSQCAAADVSDMYSNNSNIVHYSTFQFVIGALLWSLLFI